MNHKNPQQRPRYAWWQTIYAQPLSKWWPSLRKEVKIEPLDDPMEPVMSVTDETLSVRNASHNAVIAYLLPLMLASWFMTYHAYDLLWPNLQAFEDSANRFIETRKKKFGDDYFEITEDPIVLEMYNDVDENGKTSWKRYLQYRKKYYGAHSFIIDMVLIALPLLAALYFTYRVVLFRRQADIVFDRKRGIVYTWWNNTVYGCHFENLGFVENRLGLLLFFYGEFPKQGHYSIVSKYLQPTDRAYFNVNEDNSYFMALVLAFMEKGKQAVITGEQFHRKPYPFLRVDKKPHDFDARLEEVLKREHVLTEIYAENAKKQR